MRIWINHYEGPGSKLKTTAINISAKLTVRELKCIVAEKLRKMVNSFYLVYIKNGFKVLLTETFTLKFFDMKRVSVVTVVDILKNESKDIQREQLNTVPEANSESEMRSSLIVFSSLVFQAVDSISARNSKDVRLSNKSFQDQGDKELKEVKDQPRFSYKELENSNKSDEKPRRSRRPTFEKFEQVEKRVLEGQKKRDQCAVLDCCIII
jgi:hypothetical protein